MSYPEKDWAIVYSSMYSHVLEKKDGTVIVTGTWNGKGFDYSVYFNPIKTQPIDPELLNTNT